MLRVGACDVTKEERDVEPTDLMSLPRQKKSNHNHTSLFIDFHVGDDKRLSVMDYIKALPVAIDTTLN